MHLLDRVKNHFQAKSPQALVRRHTAGIASCAGLPRISLSMLKARHVKTKSLACIYLSESGVLGAFSLSDEILADPNDICIETKEFVSVT